ncbi:MAG TPA: hypothetical protein VHM91_22175 [Verrucomicrobiales bacterium]|jgi:hypothetical protein|nr:hypothetical protein [Verrucomicrobiales bacterium]
MTLERLPDGSVRISHLDEWNLRMLRRIPALASAGDDEEARRRLFPAPIFPGDAKEEALEDWKEFVQPGIEQLFNDSLHRVTEDLGRAELEPLPPRAAETAAAPATKARKTVKKTTRSTTAKKTARSTTAKKGAKSKVAKKTGKALTSQPRKSPKAKEAPEPEAPRPGRRKPGPGISPPATPRWHFDIPAEHVEDWYRAMNQARLMLSEKYEAHRTDDAHIAGMFISGNMESLIQYELFTGLCSWWVTTLLEP